MDLPEGYSFKEDDHIVLLLFKGVTVAAFSAESADPKEILKTIAEHMSGKAA